MTTTIWRAKVEAKWASYASEASLYLDAAYLTKQEAVDAVAATLMRIGGEGIRVTIQPLHAPWLEPAVQAE